LTATETVSLNGVSYVTTTTTFIRIFRMLVVTAGSTGYNEGNIKARAAGDGTITAIIDGLTGVGSNQTLMSIYTVPDNKTGYLTSYHGSVLRQTPASVDFRLLIKENLTANGTSKIKHQISAGSTGATYVHHHFEVPMVLESRSDILINVATTANNTAVTGGFEIVLVND